VHAAEQLQPPSKTGPERLRQSFSQLELRTGLAQTAKISERLVA
jgi:hypothetical protein